MKLLHGSAQNIKDGFKLFDYLIKNDGTSDGFVDNGNDAHGPGIYTLPGDPVNYAESLKGVACFTGKGDGGFIYVLNVDVDEDMLMNNRSPDEIEVDLWENVIEVYINKRHEIDGYDYNKAELILNSLDLEGQLDDIGEIDIDALYTAMEDIKDFPIDNIDPQNYSSGDGEQLIEDMLYEYKINNDPCSFIDDEGGPFGIANYAVNNSVNLWGTICKIWNSCAVRGSGLGMESFNKTFQESVFEVMGDEFELTATKIESNGIVVVFDTSAITVDKVIELNANMNRDMCL